MPVDITPPVKGEWPPLHRPYMHVYLDALTVGKGAKSAVGHHPTADSGWEETACVDVSIIL